VTEGFDNMDNPYENDLLADEVCVHGVPFDEECEECEDNEEFEKP
jgi:hypothetical protein